MGFWIQYGFAITGTKENLKKVQRRFNKIIYKSKGDLNVFRKRLGIKEYGEADWINPFALKKGILSTWLSVRCDWLNLIEFRDALERAVSKSLSKEENRFKILFCIDEGDLDVEYPLVTNDAEGIIYKGNGRPIQIVRDDFSEEE